MSARCHMDCMTGQGEGLCTARAFYHGIHRAGVGDDIHCAGTTFCGKERRAAPHHL